MPKEEINHEYVQQRKSGKYVGGGNKIMIPKYCYIYKRIQPKKLLLILNTLLLGKIQSIILWNIKIREELEHVEHLHDVVKEYAMSVQNQIEDVQKRDAHIIRLRNRINTLGMHS